MDELLATATTSLYESRSLTRHNAAARVLHHAQQLRLGTPPERRRQTHEVHRAPDLPKLAWACSVRGRHHVFTVGPEVEVGDGYLFEGVWDGDFAAGQIHRTDLAFGSGVRLGRYAVFVPPKHCWEHLYVVVDTRDRSAVVSNSALFALLHAGLEVDHPFVRDVFAVLTPSTETAGTLGFDRYDPRVAENGRYAFYRMMFHNFTVMDGTIVLAPTLATEQFDTFAHYRAFLSASLGRLARNATDSARRVTYEPITPLSSGYDSTATAVLAAELGYRDAVTQDLTIRGTFDSGATTAAALGMDVTVVHHLLGTAPIERMGVAVADLGDVDRYGEFLTTAGMGDDVILTAMEPHLGSRLVLSGALGDAIWRRASTTSPGLPVVSRYGKSFTEFRLRVGYAFVPVPALGARFPRSIQRITRDPEMAPWTLHRPYDRPIARRLAEEAGLARGSFATGKAAVNPTVKVPKDLVLAAVRHVAERYRLRSDSDRAAPERR